jgi:mRNA interferase MazF
MAKGDIVLIKFPFTDLSGSKLRPAIVLAESSQDLTVCFNTSPFQWAAPTDLQIMPTPMNGLKKQSLARIGKIATLDRDLAQGLLGRLDDKEISDLDVKLKLLLQLP